MLPAKGPIRGSFCPRAAVCRASRWSLLCVPLSLSPPTLTLPLPHFFTLFECPYISISLPQLPGKGEGENCCVLLILWLCFFHLLSSPGALCKANRKGLLPMLVPPCYFPFILRSFPFFSAICNHNCFRFTHTPNLIRLGVSELETNTNTISCSQFTGISSFCIFLPHD